MDVILGSSANFTGPGTIGQYSVRDDLQQTGTNKKNLRQFFTNYVRTAIPAGSKYSDNVLTFTGCVGFKIHAIQFTAFATNAAAAAYKAIDLIDFKVDGLSSGMSYPTASRTYGGSASSGYTSYFRLAADPDFHTMQFDGPTYVQQGNTFTITFDAYATFALNDELRIGVMITWEELA